MTLVDTEVRRTLHSDIESATAKLVYLSLARDGPGSVAELQDRLGEPRLRLYGVLDSLEAQGVVAASGAEDGAVYEAQQ